MTNKKYIHKKTAIVRLVDKLRTRKRTEASYVTREYLFVSPLSLFLRDAMSLGTTYDGTDGTDGTTISKINRNPSVV